MTRYAEGFSELSIIVRTFEDHSWLQVTGRRVAGGPVGVPLVGPLRLDLGRMDLPDRNHDLLLADLADAIVRASVV